MNPTASLSREELEDYYEGEVNHGRLYPNLDTLVEKGMVEKGQRDRRTNFYTLTSRGRRELSARQDWKPSTSLPDRTFHRRPSAILSPLSRSIHSFVPVGNSSPCRT